MLKIFLKKRTLGVLFFFCTLFSCSSTCRQWELTAIKTDCPPIIYTQASLPPANSFNGMVAELVSSGGELHFYLNALSLQFPCSEENPGYVKFFVMIDEEKYSFRALRFEGGQRLLLPEEAQQLIISALLETHSVNIVVGRFQTTLIPDNFAIVYEKMCS